MGLILEEGHVVVVDDGSVMAVRQRGKVEVWDSECETHYGDLNEFATPEEVQAAMAFYKKGVEHGEAIGRNEIQHAIRSTLGMSN